MVGVKQTTVKYLHDFSRHTLYGDNGTVQQRICKLFYVAIHSFPFTAT